MEVDAAIARFVAVKADTRDKVVELVEDIEDKVVWVDSETDESAPGWRTITRVTRRYLRAGKGECNLDEKIVQSHTGHDDKHGLCGTCASLVGRGCATQCA